MSNFKQKKSSGWRREAPRAEAGSGQAAGECGWGDGALSAWGVGRSEDPGDRRSATSSRPRTVKAVVHTPQLELFFPQSKCGDLSAPGVGGSAPAGSGKRRGSGSDDGWGRMGTRVYRLSLPASHAHFGFSPCRRACEPDRRIPAWGAHPRKPGLAEERLHRLKHEGPDELLPEFQQLQQHYPRRKPSPVTWLIWKNAKRNCNIPSFKPKAGRLGAGLWKVATNWWSKPA